MEAKYDFKGSGDVDISVNLVMWMRILVEFF